MKTVILCGGSGSRLWPLSRKNFPKQFLNLYSDLSLLQETFTRMREIMPPQDIFVVGNQENYFNIYNQLHEIEPDFAEDHVLIEPKSLNTAPAMVLAVKVLTDTFHVSPDEPILFLPADHYIGNREAYLTCVRSALAKVGDHIGTIGITPVGAHTGYGYIRVGKKEDGYYLTQEFKEKPDLKTAEAYVASGDYYWNSGMYLFNSKTFVREMKEHMPQVGEFFDKDIESFFALFHTLPSVSIDYALAEKSKNVILFPGDFGWNDVGSFDSLAETVGSTGTGTQDDRMIRINSNNVFVRSATNRLVAAIDVDDLVVVDSHDSILIHKRGSGEEVKKVVDHLKAHHMKEVEHNIVGYRPWGKYEVLIETPTYKVKKITVYPGAKLSLQSHFHRAEHWIVARGTAQIVNGDNEIVLNENESTYIPKNTKHRLSNPGKMDLEIIEVQTGNYLEENDITRYEDVYHRN